MPRKTNSKEIQKYINESAKRRKDPREFRNNTIEEISSNLRISKKLPSFKMDNLDRRQIRALENLEDAYSAMVEGPNYDVNEESNENELFYAIKFEFDCAVRKAINAGLLHHPVVENWISNHRIFGDRKALRKLKRRRLEKGVSSQISNKDFFIKYTANIYSEKELGAQAIRIEMLAMLREPSEIEEKIFALSKNQSSELYHRIKDLSRQGFRQLLVRSGWVPRVKKT